MTTSSEIGILVPVWKSYTWIAPITLTTLDRFWRPHPPVWFIGLDDSQARDLPCLSMSPETNRSNWCAVLLEGVQQMAAKGFRKVYLIAEEHVPLAQCHSQHLNETLPGLMDRLDAVYISLMGWDNRRFTSKSPVLDASHHFLKHLNRQGDPRFHLHPALWQLDVLEACCRLGLHDVAKNGSAWHFEKVNDRDTTTHPSEWREQCYQIHSASLRTKTPNAPERLFEGLGCGLYKKFQALYPMIPSHELANTYATALGFDRVFCNGPYPHYFSGIMAKGKINPLFCDFLKRHDPALCQEIVSKAPVTGGAANGLPVSIS